MNDGKVSIRAATFADAVRISAVLITSIIELCQPDHGDDPGIIETWTENKSPETVAGWISSGSSLILVAERDGAIVGVGGLQTAGEIVLNYVAPGHRGTGVSTALLAEMEKRLRAAGHAQARLTSTATAHSFYLGRGWRDAGPPIKARGGLGQPMVKLLR